MPMRDLSRLKEIKFSLIVAVAAGFSVGFADLWRGGTTVSALALTATYCALVPSLVWMWGRPTATVEDPTRPPYLAATAVGACVLAVYLLTLATSTSMWDTSEYLAAAYSFGLPHPPGNPFFVIVAHAF